MPASSEESIGREAETPAQPTAADRGARRTLLYAFLFMLFLVPVAILDPWGVRSASDAASRDLYFQLAAPFYRPGEPSETVVVLIDDRTLQVAGEVFPPSFGFYEKLLRGLGERGAKGVFLDILFADKRGDTESFPGRVKDIQQDYDMPVLLASGAPRLPDPAKAAEPPCADPDEGILHELAKSDLYRAMVYGDAPQGHYTTAARVRVGCASDARLSPAAALYRIRQVGAEVWYAEAGRRSRAAPEGLPETMVLRWGNGPSDATRALYAADTRPCPPYANDWREALVQTLDNVFRGLFHGALSDDERRSWCPATNITYVRAQELLPEWPVTDSRRAAILRAIEDRYVFVGAAFSGISDTAESPVHGRVPGVFAHAVAFDNLTAWGADVYRPWEPVPLLGFGSDNLVTLGLTFLAVLVIQALGGEEKAAEKRRGVRGLLASPLCVFLLAVVILLAVEVFFVEICGYEPTNFVGVLAVSVALIQPDLERRIKQLSVGIDGLIAGPARRIGLVLGGAWGGLRFTLRRAVLAAASKRGKPI